ncbi:hypothetical protein [Cellulomonas hominis]
MTDAQPDPNDPMPDIALAVADFQPQTGARRRGSALARGLEVVCLGLGVVTIVALFFQYLGIYFMMLSTSAEN